MSRVTRYRLLGPVEVVRDGRPAELGGPKQRAVLAILLLDAGRVVSTDRIVDAVWGDEHPPSAAASLQAYISNLRRLLRDDERATSPIVRKPPGYLIDVTPEQLDVTHFVTGCAAAQAAVDGGDWNDAVAAAERALLLWRGPLLDEYADEEWVRVAAAPLTEQRATCEQNLVVGLLGTGRVSAAVARSRRIVDDQPLAERACWLHVLALHRAGRSADALEALRGHARRMDDELGLDVGPALRDLQGAILRQDPLIASWPGGTTAPTPSVVEPQRDDAPEDGTEDPARDAERSDLVGRRREVDAISDVLTHARTDGSRWVLLTGPAGIGKSRLAEEAATLWAPHGRVVRAGCPDDEGVPAWWPIRQLLRAVDADPDTVLAVPAGVDADAARFAVYDRVARVLIDGVRAGPVLLIVEDVHWADRASLRFLTHLSGSHSALLPGLALVVTARDGVGGPDVARLTAAIARREGSRHLAVPPLGAGDVALLAHQVSGQAFDPDETDQLAERTGGNPFFVCEYARLPEDERASGEVPIAVRSVLGRRVAGLDSAVLQVLRTAAVIGETLDIDLLAAVSRLDREELADLLDEAADEHVIVAAPGSGEYVFAHALLRDEVLVGMSAIRRQRVHLRVADAVGSSGGADQTVRRAAHLVAAGPLAERPDVFDACRAAALAAEDRRHPDAAANWWGHAIEALDLLPPAFGVDRDELVIAQVAALARSGRGQTVLDVIDAAMLDGVRKGRSDSVGRLASTLLRTSGSWPWAVYGSDPGPMLARLSGVETLIAGNPAAHVSVLAALAVGSCYDPDPDVPDRISRRALDLAETLDDDDALADALLGRALTFSGVAVRAAESVTLLERLRGVEHRSAALDEVISHGLMFLATLSLGDTKAAAEHLRHGTLGSDLLRLPISRVQFRWAEGTMLHWRGEDLSACETVYNRALELHKQTELYESGVFDVAMLSLRWEQGRLAEFDLADTNPRAVPWAPAVCAADAGDGDAESLIAAELARPEPPIWTTHGRLTMLAHAVADLELTGHAEPLLRRLAPLSNCIANIGQVGVVGPVALAQARLAALLGDTTLARAHLAAATELSQQARGRGAVLRCLLLDQQLVVAEGGRPDETRLRAIADEARSRAMLVPAREAQRLLDDPAYEQAG